MKYMKRFNETVTEDFLLDLKDFCESHLAYLLDEGFIVKIDEPDEYNQSITIFLEKKGSKEVVTGSGVLVSIPFNWDEIKDNFISFIIALSKEYRMCLNHAELQKGKCISINTTNSDNFELDVNELINSDIEIRDSIYLCGLTMTDILNQYSINSIGFVIKQIKK
jgi:hypothetical protein